MARGKFITFEGIEGSGKTLQLSLLEAELRLLPVVWLLTREPGGTRFGLELRRILLGLESASREPVAELLLYMADRVQHLAEVVGPALQRGTLVLCDRYLDATLAYQGHARGLGFHLIDDLARSLGLLTPDLTLVLDLDVEVALTRARSRNSADGGDCQGRFEAEDVDFHRKVREGYLLLAQRAPERIVVIDASGTPDEVLMRVKAALESRGVWPKDAGEAGGTI